VTVSTNLYEALDYLATLREAGRVLSSTNLELVQKIGKLAAAASHHPASSEIQQIVAELVSRAAREMEEAEIQEAPPWKVVPKGGEFCVVKSEDGSEVKCFPTEEEAQAQMKALYANVKEGLEEAPPNKCRRCGAGILPADKVCPKCGWKEGDPVKEEEKSDAGLVAKPKKKVTEGVLFSETHGRIREASKAKEGKVWDIDVIRSGKSIVGRYWPPELLSSKGFLGMLEGADVFEDHPGYTDSEQYPIRRVGDHIGVIRSPKARQDGDGAVVVEARFHVIDPLWREKLKNAAEVGEISRYQFSINADGDDSQVVEAEGGKAQLVSAVYAVESVDLVTHASAGGRIRAMRESDQTAKERDMNEDELAAKIEAAVEAALARTHTTEAVDAPLDGDEEIEESGVAEANEADELFAKLRDLTARLEERERAATNATVIEEAMKASGLTGVIRESAQRRLQEAATRRSLEEADVTAIMGEYRGLAAAYAQRPPVGMGRVEGFVDRADNYELRFRAMLTPANHINPVKDAEGHVVEPFHSLREAYCVWNPSANPFAAETVEACMDELHGAKYSSTRHHKKIRESLTTAQWGEVVADNMYMSLMKSYSDLPYDDWRKVVSEIESVADFRTRYFLRIGGYGNLPAVAEGAAYQPATSPTDEHTTYSISKRGMLEQSITLEMIADDQIGALARIPTALARSAKRTLYNFVMDLITTDNPTLHYDSVVLYTAGTSHYNADTVALSILGVETAEQLMADQTAYNESLEILGDRNRPKYIIVPRELKSRALRILDPSDAFAPNLAAVADADIGRDPHQYKGSGMEVIVYDKLTNAKDWWTVGDPSLVPTVVIGFFGGRQEPEMFMQDDPASGLGFNNDTQAIKIRHIYGGSVLDHRSFTYHDVA